MKTIKNLNEESEKSIEIIKQMMKIVGIKTDDFGDCIGSIFAKKCLDRLNEKKETFLVDDEELKRLKTPEVGYIEMIERPIRVAIPEVARGYEEIYERFF